MTALTRADVVRIVSEARSKYLAPDLYGANLRGANLYGVNLYGADLRWTDLYGANLYGVNLYGADLYGANLYGADLRGANLYGANMLLRLDGLPSGQATLVPTWKGWHLTVGCWSGTVQDLRDLIAGTDWPEAKGGEQDRRRPGLTLLADLCDDHIARHPNVIDDLAKRWGDKEAVSS